MSLQPTQASFLSAAPVKWCLLSWWQYVSLALHVLWLHRCLPRSLLPSLSPSQPTHILSFPSHASKSIAETNVKWLQHPYNCAREQIKLLCGVEWVGGVGVVLGGDDEARVVVVEGWVGGGVETESLQNSALFHCWGNSRMELSYLFRKYCLSFSDKKEQ